MSGSIAMCEAGKSRRTMCRYGPISTSKPRKTRSRLVPDRNRSGSHGEPEASSNIGLGVALGRGGPMHHFAVSKKIRQLPLTKRGMPADQNLMLTERERQIILVLSEGITNKEIGRRLGLTEGTVKVHLHRIYRKLGIANRTALAVLAHTGTG